MTKISVAIEARSVPKILVFVLAKISMILEFATLRIITVEKERYAQMISCFATKVYLATEVVMRKTPLATLEPYVLMKQPIASSGDQVKEDVYNPNILATMERYAIPVSFIVLRELADQADVMMKVSLA